MRADELWPLGQCPPCIGAAMWGCLPLRRRCRRWPAAAALLPSTILCMPFHSYSPDIRHCRPKRLPIPHLCTSPPPLARPALPPRGTLHAPYASTHTALPCRSSKTHHPANLPDPHLRPHSPLIQSAIISWSIDPNAVSFVCQCPLLSHTRHQVAPICSPICHGPGT